MIHSWVQKIGDGWADIPLTGDYIILPLYEKVLATYKWPAVQWLRDAFGAFFRVPVVAGEIGRPMMVIVNLRLDLLPGSPDVRTTLAQAVIGLNIESVYPSGYDHINGMSYQSGKLERNFSYNYCYPGPTKAGSKQTYFYMPGSHRRSISMCYKTIIVLMPGSETRIRLKMPTLKGGIGISHFTSCSMYSLSPSYPDMPKKESQIV